MNIKSIDLRSRVIDFIEAGGKIFEACSLFKVSSSSIYRWRQLKNKAGHIAPNAPIRSAYKINDEALTAYLETHPDAYQTEIAEYFKVTQSCISRAFRRLNITRKKRVVYIKKEMN